MNCTSFITFILKGQQYYLYDHVVKDLPIFQELKKSDKLETIPYEHDLSQDDIQFVFNVINDWCNDKNITGLQQFINIYLFLKFLNVDVKKIDQFCSNNLCNIDLLEAINFGIENNYVSDYFKVICRYCKNRYLAFETVKKLQVDDNIKLLLAKNKIYHDHNDGSEYDVHYARVSYTKDLYSEQKKRKYDNLYYIKNIYNNYLQTDNVKVVYEKHQFKEFFVNDKPVEVCGDTDLWSDEDEFIGINLYDTIVNHIALVLLGKIEL